MDLTSAAKAVAAEGYRVFPCDTKKRPCWSNEDLGCEPGEGGFKVATPDPEEIERLFAHPRAALVGVATGDGLAVIDIDVKAGKGGQDWYERHIADLGMTRWHMTKSGGIHLLYEANGIDPGTSAGVIHDGVDIRADGGYVIWWPAHGCEFGDVELAPFPEWIEQEIGEKSSAWAAMPDDDLEGQILKAENFHQPMVSLACRLAHHGYSSKYIKACLVDLFDRSKAANAKHGRHRDWAKRKLDIHRTVDSALEKAGRAETLQRHPEEPEPEPAEPATKVERLALPSVADHPASRWDGTRAPSIEFVIEDLGPRGRLTNVAGIGGAGKGILLQTAATCISAGLPFLGKTTLQGPVAYYSAEDEDSVLHHRQARINDLLGLRSAPEGLFIKSYLGFDLSMFDGKRWTRAFGWLWNDIDKVDSVVAAIIDPASEVFVGDFLSPVSVKTFCRAFDIEAVKRNISVFMSMHTAKGSGEKTPFGSAQWMYAARTTLVLDPVVGEDGKPLRDQAVLRVAKGNFVKPGTEIELTWTEDGLLVQKDEPDAYEQIARVRELENLIVELCDTAWRAGAPLSDASQARERYLPAKVRQVAKSKFPKRDIVETMESMMRAGKLKLGRTHDRRGLKVVKDDNE